MQYNHDYFSSDQDIRWCPGCGDYAILKNLKKSFAIINQPKHNIVVISGIGCSSRLPYYLSTYGFHSIHGRAPAIATGIKLTNPKLDVWIITGDGDALSIGSNHLAHILRRDINVQILLCNNAIYGLTKGQASPTSNIGSITPTSPTGSNTRPMHPCLFALGSGATFIARSADIFPESVDIFTQARNHNGAAFIEILQNCHIYNDKAFNKYTNKKNNLNNAIFLQHNKLITFGEEQQWVIALNNNLQLQKIPNNKSNANKAIIHDKNNINLTFMLLSFEQKNDVKLFGIIYQQDNKNQITDTKIKKLAKSHQDIIKFLHDKKF